MKNKNKPLPLLWVGSAENKPPPYSISTPLLLWSGTNENKPMGDFTVPLISVKYAFY